MTTEEDFQTALDANPEDWQTRLVFADWLDEHADPRAAGYRALGMLRLRAMLGLTPDVWWMADGERVRPGPRDPYRAACLPLQSWFRGIIGSVGRSIGDWFTFDTRREAEDAAARAFARLPEACRAELLNHELVGVP